MGTKRGPVKARTKSERLTAIPGLGDRLRQLLANRSKDPKSPFTLPDLVKLLGIPYSTIKQWNYEDKIGAADAVRLATWGECSLDWLLTGHDKRSEMGPSSPAAARSAEKGTALAAAALMLAKKITDIISKTIERQELGNLSHALLVANMLTELSNFLQVNGVPREALEDMRRFAQDLLDGRYG